MKIWFKGDEYDTESTNEQSYNTYIDEVNYSNLGVILFIPTIKLDEPLYQYEGGEPMIKKLKRWISTWRKK
jgi:hypothetical protein